MGLEGKRKNRRNIDLCNLPITVITVKMCKHSFVHHVYSHLTNQELWETLWHPPSQFQLVPPLQYLFLEYH